ncbi:MAG TPA: hypothetical protein VGD66_15950 [Allosphingosinicella sp.]|jgi:hypothetical protein
MRPVSRAALAGAAVVWLMAAAPPPAPAGPPGDVLCMQAMTMTLALAKDRPSVAPPDAVQRMENAVAFFAGAAGAHLDDEAFVREFREAAVTFSSTDRLKLFQDCDARFGAGLRRAQEMLHRSAAAGGGGASKP